MVQKRPPVDYTVIDEALGKLPPQQQRDVRAAVETFPKPDILKGFGKDTTLLDSAKALIGTVRVNKKGVVESVPLYKVTKEGDFIPSLEATDRDDLVPFEGLDIGTAAAQLGQVLGIPIVDRETRQPTQEFLNLLQTQGNRPLDDVLRDAATGRLGTKMARGITEAMVAPKRPVITQKEFEAGPESKEEAVRKDMRDRYFLRHRDNPNEKFGSDYTPMNWVEDFDSRISAIAERQYRARVPYPEDTGEEPSFNIDKVGGVVGSSFENVQKNQREWEKGRLEAISNGIAQSIGTYRRQNKIPRAVLEMFPDRFSSSAGEEAKSLKDVVGDTLAAGREIAQKGKPFDALEIGVMETMSPATKRILGQEVPMRLDERDMPPEQRPTLGSMLQLRSGVEPAQEAGERNIELQKILEWGEENRLTKDSIDTARMRGLSYVEVLKDLYDRRDSEEVKEIISRKNQEELYGPSMSLTPDAFAAPAAKESEMNWQAGTETAAAVPFRALSFFAGLPVGAVEGVASLAGGLVEGKDPSEVRFLKPATAAEKDQLSLLMARYPNLSESQKKFVGQQMMEAGDYISDLQKEEIERKKTMLGKDLVDRLKENSAEIVEGIAALSEAFVGATGDAYMATGKTPEDRLWNSLKEANVGGKTMGAGAVIQLYNAMKDPAGYYASNPLDAIMAAVPLLKAAKLDGRLKEWSKTASSKAVSAVNTLLKTGDEIITKLDKKTADSIAGYGVVPLKVLQQATRQAIIAGDSVGEAARRAKASLDRFLKDPAALRELNATLALETVIDATDPKNKKLADIQDSLQSIVEKDGPAAAAQYLEETVRRELGEEAYTRLNIASKADLLRRAEDAPMQPRPGGAERFEEIARGVADEAGQAMIKTTEEVAASPLGDKITVIGRLFDEPEVLDFHGAQKLKETGELVLGARTKHPRYTATSFLLNPSARPKVLFSDPKATAATLKEMKEQGRVTYPDGKQMTGVESTQDLQAAGLFDPRVTPTQSVRDAGRGAEFLAEADRKVNEGLKSPEIDNRINELENDYINIMDKDVLAQYGFENTRDMLRSIGVGGKELQNLMRETELGQVYAGKLSDYHKGAGIHVRKELFEKKQPVVKDVEVGLPDPGQTVKDLELLIADAKKSLGAGAKSIPDLDLQGVENLSQKRTKMLSYLRRLEEAADKSLAGEKTGRLKPSVVESLKETKRNINKFYDEVYRNPQVLFEDIVESLSSPGKLAESRILGKDAQRILRLRKNLQDKSKGVDTGLTDKLAELDNKIADALVKDILGKEGAVKTAVDYVYATLEREKAKRVKQARSEAVNAATVDNFADAISGVSEGKKVESLPAALKDSPENLMRRLDKGGELYNELYSKKPEGVTDFEFQRQVKNVQRRLKRYVPASAGGKATLDYLGLTEAEGKRVFVPKSFVAQTKWEVAAQKAYAPLASMAKAAATAGRLGSHFTNYATYFQTQLGRGRGILTPMYLIDQAQDIFARKRPYQLGIDPNTPKGFAAYQRYTRKMDALDETNFIDRGSILRELNVAEKAIDNPLEKKKARGILEAMKEKAGNLSGAWERNVYGPMKKAYGGLDQIAKHEQAKYSFDYFDDMYQKLAEGETISYRINPEGREVTVRKGTDGKIYREDGNKRVEITDKDLANIQAKAAAADANAILFDYNKIPNIVKLNKILGRAGISIPFFTYFWKALDIPGYKKGLGEAMMSGVPYIRTSDPALRKSDTATRLRNAAKINIVNMTVRDRLKEVPDDLLKELVSALPRQARAAFIRNIGLPGKIGIKELDYMDPRNPSLATAGLLVDIVKGRPATTTMKRFLETGQNDGVERFWMNKDNEVDVDLKSKIYRNPDNSLTELGKKTKAQRNEILSQLSKPDRRGVGAAKTLGFGAGIFRDLVMALDPVMQGDPLETDKMLQVLRRTALSVVTGSSIENAIDGGLAELESQGVELPAALKSRLSARLKQFKAPDYEELSKNGIDVLSDTMRRITSIGFDVRDVASDKKRYLRGVRRQLNSSFLSDVNNELKKIATEPGDPESVDRKRYGNRADEIQERLNKLLKHRGQMREIVDGAIRNLDTIATAALNVTDMLRSDKAKGLGKPLFSMERNSKGELVKRKYRMNPRTGQREYFDALTGLYKTEPTTDTDNIDLRLLDEALGLMGPRLIEQSKETIETYKVPEEGPREGFPAIQKEEEDD